MRKVVKGRTRTSGSESQPGAGFSLVELLVALVLVIAVLSVAPAFFSQGISSAEFRNSARQLAAGLRATQAKALSNYREQVFLLDLEARWFSTGGTETTTTLPDDLDLKLKTVESERLSESRGGIRFFPDGSSTGGEINLARNGRVIKVAVNWVSGKVSIVAPD